ncbi:TetR/AcrR family transcriptional regulator [Cellulomonas sp. KRMCY2]|uniref:TetR/AcrR family transcriptional regulator n=1 Tax=Cellulomonas sp. KRMCY2 TaxID=1304865 RepID=UPI00045EBE34|nr:TetR/AcrR family transcriptional regulator [Cellulomonas sp. KRMCY2]
MTSGPRAGGAELRGYARGRATRRQILDEAVRLFAEVGYRAASLRELAARCGISHPGLLHHFPSKAVLLSAVLAQRDELDSARYLASAGSGLDQLRGMVALVEHNVEVPALVELHASLSAEATDPLHPAHAWCVRRYETTRRQFEQVLVQARADGILRSDVDPAVAATALAALMDGLQVQWLLDRSAVDMVVVLRDHLGRLLTCEL